MEAIGYDGTLDLERCRLIGDVETGYTYFREGDVTIAKITPCFENGKGAVMSGLIGGIDFGTTELIVARPLLDETTSAFCIGSLFQHKSMMPKQSQGANPPWMCFVTMDGLPCDEWYFVRDALATSDNCR